MNYKQAGISVRAKLLPHLMLLSIFMLLLCFACKESPDPEPMAHDVKGVSLSPRSYSQEDFLAFLENASAAGRYLTWAGDWMTLSDPQGAADVTAQLAPQYGMEPVILTSWFNTETGAPIREMSDSLKGEFLFWVLDFARAYQPPYMVFGVELNTAYDYSHDNYNEFVNFFPLLADCMAVVSPGTEIGVDFLLEKMKGYRGGLFGGVNDTTNTQWHLLDDFPAADFLGFNTYPSLIFAHPDSIPGNYYSQIIEHTNKPIAFFEMGWHTGSDIANWESSEAEQSRFVERFFGLVGSDVKLVIWPFLYDQEIQSPFNTMGLFRRTDGNAKQAWDVWLEQ